MAQLFLDLKDNTGFFFPTAHKNLKTDVMKSVDALQLVVNLPSCVQNFIVATLSPPPASYHDLSQTFYATLPANRTPMQQLIVSYLMIGDLLAQGKRVCYNYLPTPDPTEPNSFRREYRPFVIKPGKNGKNQYLASYDSMFHSIPLNAQRKAFINYLLRNFARYMQANPPPYGSFEQTLLYAFNAYKHCTFKDRAARSLSQMLCNCVVNMLFTEFGQVPDGQVMQILQPIFGALFQRYADASVLLHTRYQYIPWININVHQLPPKISLTNFAYLPCLVGLRPFVRNKLEEWINGYDEDDALL